jgi:hypothetical protein
MTIIDFSKDANLDNWFVVNDDVMGGRSSAELSYHKDGFIEFMGKVSLENNGGFSSIRYSFDQKKIKGLTKAIIKLKGDGKKYKFRVKSDSYERFSYSYEFETTGDWQEVIIPLEEMFPSFRGRILDIPNYPAELISEITFLIGNKKAESFKLQIAKIELDPQ